jgi:hypothetical protein
MTGSAWRHHESTGLVTNEYVYGGGDAYEAAAPRHTADRPFGTTLLASTVMG